MTQERKKIKEVMATMDPELVLINKDIEDCRRTLSELLSRKNSIERRLLRENEEYKSLSKQCRDIAKQRMEEHYRKGNTMMTPTKRKVLKEKLEKMPLEKTEEDPCVVCSENRRNVVFLPCGHKALCSSCVIKILETKLPCPICREKFGDMAQVFEN